MQYTRICILLGEAHPWYGFKGFLTISRLLAEALIRIRARRYGVSFLFLSSPEPLFALLRDEERLARVQGCGKGTPRRRIRNRCVSAPLSSLSSLPNTTRRPWDFFSMLNDPQPHFIAIAFPPATCLPAFWLRRLLDESTLDSPFRNPCLVNFLPRSSL